MIAGTHSVAAITLGCQRTSLRFLPLPVQPVSRPARPPRGGRMHAPRLPVHPAAARAPHYRRLRARSRSGRPHAPQPPARPAVGRTPRSRTHAPRPPMRPAAPQPAGNARLGGLGGGCLRAGRRRRCPPRLSLHRRRLHAAGHSGPGAGGQGEVAEAGVGLQGVLALSVASARRTAQYADPKRRTVQYADTRVVTRRGLRVPGSERCRGGT